MGKTNDHTVQSLRMSKCHLLTLWVLRAGDMAKIVEMVVLLGLGVINQ
jgi:hypothetical protein